MCFGFISEYTDLTLTPYIDIYWGEDAKERGSKVCFSIGWLFWEFYIDIV